MENACICISEKLNDICALITPNDKQLRLLAKDLGKDGLSREQLCDDPQIQQAVMEAVLQVCQSDGLHRRETPVKIHLCAEEWLPDNELLTAAFKLKRRQVNDRYKSQIESMFAQLSR